MDADSLGWVRLLKIIALTKRGRSRPRCFAIEFDRLGFFVFGRKSPISRLLPQAEFLMLKKHRQGSTFFAIYRRDAQACSPECNQEYHNAKYQRGGKFMKRYYRRKKEKLRELKKLFQVRLVYHPALRLGLDYSLDLEDPALGLHPFLSDRGMDGLACDA
jgi:hypothetical protein